MERGRGDIVESNNSSIKQCQALMVGLSYSRNNVLQIQ